MSRAAAKSIPPLLLVKKVYIPPLAHHPKRARLRAHASAPCPPANHDSWSRHTFCEHKTSDSDIPGQPSRPLPISIITGTPAYVLICIPHAHPASSLATHLQALTPTARSPALPEQPLTLVAACTASIQSPHTPFRPHNTQPPSAYTQPTSPLESKLFFQADACGDPMGLRSNTTHYSVDWRQSRLSSGRWRCRSSSDRTRVR